MGFTKETNRNINLLPDVSPGNQIYVAYGREWKTLESSLM